MSNFHTMPVGVQDSTGIPAASKVTANTQVQTLTGTISLISDIFTWPGPSTTGNFILPMTRVTINGVPGINQSTSGIALNAAGVPVATTVTLTDSNTSGL